MQRPSIRKQRSRSHRKQIPDASQPGFLDRELEHVLILGFVDDDVVPSGNIAVVPVEDLT